MRKRASSLPLAVLLSCQLMSAAEPARLMILDPGHFHASLLQKESSPWLSNQVTVYAPLGPGLIDYLDRVAQFNQRGESPTAWTLDVHAGPDFLQRMLRERPGNVVVISGRNGPKIDRIAAAVGAGLNVLADKPWIIVPGDMGKLERVLEEAGRKGLVAYDIMTERDEITSILQRELVNDERVFGRLLPGSGAEPAIAARSVHHLMKTVAGIPLRRPVWFFDTDDQGEGLSDVGTHVVDMVQWTAFPTEFLDYRTDVAVLDARHWPTSIPLDRLKLITGQSGFPGKLAGRMQNGAFEYMCNNSVHYTIKGVHVKLEILWNWEAPEGSGDIYEARFRGTKARVEIRQGAVPELFVIPNRKGEALEELRRKIESLRTRFPGLEIEERDGEARIVIPQHYRVGHEQHFAQVANRFSEYLQAPRTVPAWEAHNMLVKYYITTQGTARTNNVIDMCDSLHYDIWRGQSHCPPVAKRKIR